MTSKILDDNSKSNELWLAARAGEFETVQELVRNHADIQLEYEPPGLYNQNQTPLYIASRYDRTKICQLLLQHGANPNVQDELERTPLFYSVCRGNVALTKLLLQHQALTRGMGRQKEGTSPLHWVFASPASVHHRPTLIRLLLQHGADIGAVDRNGESPLHLAASQNEEEVFRLLIHPGSMIVSKSTKKTPLCVCRRRFHRRFAGILLATHEDWEENVVAFVVKSTLEDRFLVDEVVPTLVNGHSDIVKRFGASLLLGAIPLDRRFSLPIVRMLLTHGAGRATEKCSQSPLYSAVQKNDLDLARMLIEGGIDIDSRSSSGRTPLFAACLDNHMELIEFLLSNNANVNAVDNNGYTALHRYIQMNSGSWRNNHHMGPSIVVKMLINAGANPKISSSNGSTPLHAAAARGMAKCARLLLEGGADAFARDEGGQTVAHLVAKDKRKNALMLLRTLLTMAPKSLILPDRDGWLPVELACMSNNLDSTYLMLRADPVKNVVSRYRRSPRLEATRVVNI